jgi:folate-binding protein YgfZ
MTQEAHFATLTDRSVVAVGGPDWRDFLQGLLTQDVEQLKPGELRFGALLTPQGRLLWDVFILGTEDGCLLDVAADRREAFLQRLAMYRLRAKVTLQPADTAVLALWGRAGGPGWAEDPRIPQLGFRGYGVSPPDGATEADYAAHARAQGVPGPADWGYEESYPIEADFDLLNGIDFRKGCFVGQETTSRMKRRGQVKTRFLPLTFEGAAPAPGSEVLAGDLRAGEVLSGGEGRAMASLRLDRIAGALTAGGKAVHVAWPDWLPREFA